MKNLQEDYVYVSSEGDFSLWVHKPAYKIYQVQFPFAVQDTKTQQVLNETQLVLRKYLFDEQGQRYEHPFKDQDHYQIICLNTKNL